MTLSDRWLKNILRAIDPRKHDVMHLRHSTLPAPPETVTCPACGSADVVLLTKCHHCTEEIVRHDLKDTVGAATANDFEPNEGQP
jgi:hypothetical protein